jgi:uric acid-xanthine permease
VEIFGSPFMRNCSTVIGLMVGYFAAAIATVDGKRYVTSAIFDAAPAASFIWTTTFPIGFYPPAILPLIIV